MFRKTKLSEKLHTLIAALIVFFLFAGSFDLSCMYAYADEPEHIVFNQMNVVAEAYINDDRYVGQSPNFTVMNGYVQQAENLGLAANNPARYELPTPGGGRLEITNQTDGSERSWDVEIEGNTYYLCNLTPGCIYSCVLRDKEDNDIVKKSYTVEVTGSLRMIYLEGTTNFRDLGGWNVGRGKIKYNRIIRGAATAGRADSVGNRFALTDKDKDLLWQLGIDHEYDLRKDTDEDDIPGTPAEKYQSEIPGIENQYTRISILNYQQSLNQEGKENFERLLHAVMSDVVEGKTIYLHCQAGADRTGTACFMLEGLLGMSDSDLDKEYELTSFYAPRYRDGSEGYTYNKYREMKSYLYQNYSGNNNSERVIDWFLKNGFEYDELNAFRSAMIDGDPEPLVDPDAPPVNPDDPDPDKPDPDDPVNPQPQPQPTKTDLSKAAVSGLPASLVYDGSYRKPSFTLKVNGKVLSAGTDYKVSWTSNKNVGRADITVQGTGAYEGTKKLSFKIVPRKPSSVKGKKKTAKKYRSAGKNDRKRAVIRSAMPSTKKMKKARKLSSAKTRRVFKPAGKAKRTVYVQVRTLKKTAAGTYYSAWSKVIRIKR